MATIKDLIGIGPDELAKLSDEELRKRCEPYLMIATVVEEEVDEGDQLVSLDNAPDRAQRANTKRTATRKSNREDLMKEMAELAKLHGININIPTPIK